MASGVYGAFPSSGMSVGSAKGVTRSVILIVLVGLPLGAGRGSGSR